MRTVGAGFVSGPLVWSAAVGDLLKLGAPMGEMGIDKESQRDVLLHRRRHGLAPLKAIIDEMTRWNTRAGSPVLRRPPADDLYDMRALHRIAALNRWLTIVPCVSDDPVSSASTATCPTSSHGTAAGGPRRLPVRLARHDPRDPVPAARDRGAAPSASPSTWPRTCTRRRHR